MRKPVIIVHGGAGKVSEELAKRGLEGCIKALDSAWKILSSGGSALDAVEEAVRIMEDFPWLNAGLGSNLNMEGFVEMDAFIMDGSTLRAGAVAAVRRIKNPVKLARLVMEKTKHILLVGEGAEKFATSMGIELIDPKSLITEYQLNRWKREKEKIKANSLGDTVGAVALDIRGNLAVAVSTGGIFMKLPGRVGDTPLIGAGGYADNEYGAASATGLGEAAMRVLLSKTVVDLIANGFDAQSAAKEAIRILERRTGGWCGVIVVDKEGNIGIYHNTPIMRFAYRTPDEFGSGIYM